MPPAIHSSPLSPVSSRPAGHSPLPPPATQPSQALPCSVLPPGLPRTRCLSQGGPSLYACALSLRPCASVNSGKEGNTHQGLHWLLPGSPRKGEVLLPPPVEPTLARAPAALCRAREAGQAPGLEGCQLQLPHGSLLLETGCISPLTRQKPKRTQYHDCASFRHIKTPAQVTLRPLRSCQVCVICADDLPVLVGSRCSHLQKNAW